MKRSKFISIFAGLAFLVICLLLPAPEGMTPGAWKAAVVAILMALWWITEPIPIYATAFLPMVLFPLFRVMPAAETAVSYGHDMILMMISGFFLAKAIEVQGLHRRIALVLIKALGTSRSRIILSIMVATALLSMWIANVTAALMMLPIGMAIITKEEEFGDKSPRFGVAVMLGIAYSASVGGLGTLIGSPTNLIFGGMMTKIFPLAPAFGFLSWMQVGIPIVVIFLPLVWYFLVKFLKIKGSIPGSRELIEEELRELGKMSPGEKRVTVVFLFTVIGWVFREGFAFDRFNLPGWSQLLGISEFVSDSTVGMFSASLLFMIPDSKGKRLLDWKAAGSIPWGVGVIVGGGYALASGFKSTGLADWLGYQLAFVSNYPTLVIMIIVCGAVMLFTEMNSNTATANIFLPVLASMAVAGNINPLLLMVPATFASSMVFIMPAGTGPNTVIFGSNRVTVQDMARAGIWLKLISIVLVPLILYVLIIHVSGIDLALPGWAR